jgi:hypothetical protein
MDFSLSSSLVGSAVSNPDKLALDLQFAADKTLTARKGPTPVFTRTQATSTGSSYVGSDGLIQYAAANQARFDHDPISPFACKGLLIEEQRTNICLRSESIATWVGSFTNNGSTTAPDGTSSGFLAGIGTGNCQTPITSSVTGSYTSSVYLKRNNTDWVRIQGVQGANVNTVNVWINLNNGTAGTVSVASGTPTLFSAQIIPAGNDWYRCSVTASYPATNYLNLNILSATADASTTRVAGSIYGVWGGQIEAGSFATSYIPTTTASVIRSADVCSISGSDFSGFYNPLEGSFATSTIFNSPANLTKGEVVFDVNDTTALNRTRFVRNATNGFLIYANTVAGTQDVAIFGSTAMAAGVVTKLAGCMKANDFTVYLNNVSQGVDTISVMQPAPTTLTIGDASSGNPIRALMNGTIGSLRYFRKRLPNAKLQALTV